MTKSIVPVVLEFEATLLRSVGQAVRGEYAALHTPEQIAAHKRDRMFGTVKANAKEVSTTIDFDVDVLEPLKVTAHG